LYTLVKPHGQHLENPDNQKAEIGVQSNLNFIAPHL